MPKMIHVVITWVSSEPHSPNTQLVSLQQLPYSCWLQNSDKAQGAKVLNSVTLYILATESDGMIHLESKHTHTNAGISREVTYREWQGNIETWEYFRFMVVHKNRKSEEKSFKLWNGGRTEDLFSVLFSLEHRRLRWNLMVVYKMMRHSDRTFFSG